MAMGNGTSTPGMNQKLLPFLQAQKGKRFGIVCVYIYFSAWMLLNYFFCCITVLDFYDAVPGLVEAVIGL